ncbi:unnamed protein product [Urochloa humidicola]
MAGAVGPTSQRAEVGDRAGPSRAATRAAAGHGLGRPRARAGAAARQSFAGTRVEQVKARRSFPGGAGAGLPAAVVDQADIWCCKRKNFRKGEGMILEVNFRLRDGL